MSTNLKWFGGEYCFILGLCDTHNRTDCVVYLGIKINTRIAKQNSTRQISLVIISDYLVFRLWCLLFLYAGYSTDLLVQSPHYSDRNHSTVLDHAECNCKFYLVFYGNNGPP